MATVSALSKNAISNPPALYVCNLNEDVGRVDCGFVRTVAMRAIRMVFRVRSEGNGFVKFRTVPLADGEAVQEVWM